MLEAVLVYRPAHPDGATIPVGQTADAQTVRALGNQLLRDAEREAGFWQGVDETLGTLKAAEAERLRAVLEYLLGVEGSAPDLHLVPNE